ncbi:MAG: excinuclease ABC subunit UvrC [Phycisphaerae bacterium]|nr:excinuclease ABC subunit UvrC [Phycisphaerae bacterium]
MVGDSDGNPSLRDKIRNLPKSPGVYLMKDGQGRVLYIGKAKDLRSRVGSYFQDSADLLATRGPEIAHMVGLVADIDFLECDTEVDALLQENRLIKDIQPRYNERLRDDKSFPYLEITVGEDFPGVFVTRKPRRKGVKLYGPFTSAAGLRDAVNALQKVFKFRTCELDIRAADDKRRFFRPCLLHSINQCTAPCADRISREQYRADIDRLKRFLASKRSVILRQMEQEMKDAAADLRFEDAALLRDRIKAIQSLSLSGDVDEHVQPEVFHVDPRAGLERLAKLLRLDQAPRIVEGIDIANLHGEESVGSLVCFIDGMPFKGGYRRFRIRSVEGIDDYAMIREVVQRRYKHAAEGEELFPDVILIDGGLGQLHAALEACTDMFVKPPMVISLAKREELIYIQKRAQPVKLSRNDAALRLVQHIRDEAHRFAQHYHHILRRKKVFEEELREGRRPPPVQRPAKSGKGRNRAGGKGEKTRRKSKTSEAESAGTERLFGSDNPGTIGLPIVMPEKSGGQVPDADYRQLLDGDSPPATGNDEAQVHPDVE